MSQVRKLLNGNNIPKAEKGYKFHLDSQDIYLTDDDLKEIDDKIAALPMERRRFLGNATTAIKAGDQSGNRANNTWTSDMMSGLDERNMERLKKQEASFWESFLPTDSYYAKQAGNDLLHIIYTVANKKKNETTVDNSKKKTIGSDPISIDFNTDAEGKLYMSPYSYGPKTRIAQILEHLEKGENSPYVTDGWDFADINTWLNGLTLKEGEANKYESAKNIFKDYWTKLGVHGFDSEKDYNGEDLKDLFNLFKIGFDPKVTSSTIHGNQDILGEDGKPDPTVRKENGEFIVRKGILSLGEDPDSYYVYQDEFDRNVPYLITDADLKKFGLDEDSPLKYAWVYKDRIYIDDPKDIAKMPIDLQEIVEEVKDINKNTNLTGAERYERLSKKLNWKGKELGYRLFDVDPERYFYTNPNIQSLIGERKVSLSDVSRNYGFENPDDKILLRGYDNSNNADTYQWGFRRPFYLLIDKNGNITSTLRDGENPLANTVFNPFAEGNPFDPNNYIGEWWTDEKTNKRYGLYKIAKNTNGVDLQVYFSIELDANGNKVYKYWIPDSKGNLKEISSALKEKIDKKQSITPNEIAKGMARSTTGEWLKDGGKINHIAKLQYGENIPEPVAFTSSQTNRNNIRQIDQTKEPSTVFDETGEFHWENLDPADKNELIAAGLDLLGAGIGWAGPYGSIGGAALGLGSTVLNTISDAQRGVKWWQNALTTTGNLGLDLVSVIPEIGEVAQITKFAKVAERLAKNAKVLKLLGTFFNAHGLYNAIPPLMKIQNGQSSELTADDIYALTNGVRVLMNVSRTRFRNNRGDAQLAEKITETKNNLGLNDPVHTSNGVLSSDVKIKFEPDELKQIQEAGPEAGNVLVNILKSKNADLDKLEVNPEALLTRFGFTVTKGADGKIASVASPEGYTLETHTRTVPRKGAGTTEEIKLKPEETEYILKGGEEAPKRLREVLENNWGVDPTKINMNDGALLKEYNFGYNAHLRGPNKGKIYEVFPMYGKINRGAAKINPKEQYTKWGYLTDLWNGADSRRAFIDAELSGNKAVKSQIDALMTTPGENAPSRAMRTAYARSQVRRGQTPHVRNRLGFIEPSIYDEKVNVSETPPQSNATVERLQAIREKAKAAQESGRSVFAEQKASGTSTTSVTTNTDNISSNRPSNTPTVDKKESVDFGKRKAIEARHKQIKVARNIDAIRKSKDPMLTLRQLTEADEKFDQMVFDNQEAFKEALQESLRNMANEHPRFWDIDSNKKYMEGLMKFAEDHNLFLFKKGGIIKGQPGISSTDWGKWYEPGFTVNVMPPTPSWKKSSLYPETNTDIDLWPEGTNPSDKLQEGFNKANNLFKQFDLSMKLHNNGFNPYVFQTTTTSKKPDVGGPTQPIKNRTKSAFLISEGLGFLNALTHQNAYRKEDERRINDGRHSVLTQQVDLLPTINPLFQQQLNQIGLNKRSGLTGIATNDWISYNAALNQNQYQSNAMMNNVYSQWSQDQFSRDSNNVGLTNQRYGYQTEGANKNRELDAYFNSMMHNPRLAQLLQQYQSIDNIKNLGSKMISQDMNKIQAYNQSVFTTNQKNGFDGWLRDTYSKETEEYSKLNWQERMQYAGLEDYIKRTNPASIDEIDRRRQQDNSKYLEWLMSNGLNFDYGALAGRQSPETDVNHPLYVKKGGYLRGSTRYTKEPDEQIWINNNKATQYAVAKLNEATIKMLLSALK